MASWDESERALPEREVDERGGGHLRVNPYPGKSPRSGSARGGPGPTRSRAPSRRDPVGAMDAAGSPQASEAASPASVSTAVPASRRVPAFYHSDLMLEGAAVVAGLVAIIYCCLMGWWGEAVLGFGALWLVLWAGARDR